MVKANKALFASFKEVHDKYQKDQETWQNEFNEKGQAVIVVVRDWEKRLCSHMEKGENALYSSSLADKFWAEVRGLLPLIDFVGVQIS